MLRSMSSKHAAARGNRELLLFILSLIDEDIKDRRSITTHLSSKHNKDRVARTLQYLRQQKYITGRDSYTLTKRGTKTLSEEKIWNLSISTPKKWDGKWRIVLFDIPKHKQKRRDIFRLRLKGLGLVLYQNSVWIHPYPLEETVRAIGDFYSLSDCIHFIVAERVTGEKTLRKHFSLA